MIFLQARVFVGAVAIALGACMANTTARITAYDGVNFDNNLAVSGVGLTGQLLSILSLVSISLIL